MKSHKIYLRRARPGLGKSLDQRLLKHCVRTALDAEGVNWPCEVSVLVTDDAGIRVLNGQYRDKDAATDVLSFPMQLLTPGRFEPDPSEADPETGVLPLGDIVLSADRIAEQAARFGHDENRKWPISSFTPSCICWATTMWTRARTSASCGAREKEILEKAGLGE